MITCHEIPMEGALYAQSVELRREVLRRPLGLDFSTAELAAEADERRCVAVVEDRVVGTLNLVRHGDAFKMRQVAVAPDAQGQGIGKRLVQFSEAVALRAGATRMVLHARETAVPFYLSLGYHIVDEPFEEVGIPHRRMVKALEASE
ncbi:MAG: GNAT family N-acetyltransferase [Fimbriimonadaceae bacterium]|nr:GNAT family N-acetyltransferase [Fimbriimonadaceae bacterium]